MGIAVVLILDDDGQMMVGEVDPATIDTAGFQPVETFEEGVTAAEALIIGTDTTGAEEAAFNQSVNAPATDPLLDEMG
jgi:hypothetical protein